MLAADDEVEGVGEAEADAGDDEERDVATDLGRDEGEEAQPRAEGDEQQRALREPGRRHHPKGADGREGSQREQHPPGLVAEETARFGGERCTS